MATFLSTITQLANQAGIELAKRSKSAVDWFRSEVKQVMLSISGNELMRETDGNTFIKTRYIGNSAGRMVMFFYDPKLKKELPYYDRWPLIFVIGPKKGADGQPGFLGLNMHYLEPRLRAQLFDALYTTINKKARKTDNIKMFANQSASEAWNIIKAVSRSGLYKPCVKHYLNKHVRSQFVMVHHDNWHKVLFLPTERFERGGKGRQGRYGGHISLTEVWRDSRRIAGR